MFGVAEARVVVDHLEEAAANPAALLREFKRFFAEHDRSAELPASCCDFRFASDTRVTLQAPPLPSTAQHAEALGYAVGTRIKCKHTDEVFTISDFNKGIVKLEPVDEYEETRRKLTKLREGGPCRALRPQDLKSPSPCFATSTFWTPRRRTQLMPCPSDPPPLAPHRPHPCLFLCIFLPLPPPHHPPQLLLPHLFQLAKCERVTDCMLSQLAASFAIHRFLFIHLTISV